MKNYIIEIAAGQTFIEAANIPNWIADKLEPIPEELPALCRLTKRSLIGENHWREDDLTPDDWSLLDDIWSDLPEVQDAEIERFKDYKQAFDQAKNKPDWVLHAEFQHLKEEAKTRRMNCRHKHFDLLEAAAKSGKLTILSAQRVPMDKIEPGALISVASARTYLEPLGFDLREQSSTAEQSATVALSLENAVEIDCAAKEMGRTVKSLLMEAASSTRLLYVALKPHSAALSAIPGHANPRQGSRTTKAHSIVAMLPQYAESLAIGGSADIAQFQAGFVPPLDWHYWILSKPQTVGIDSVFVPRADMTHDASAVSLDQADRAAKDERPDPIYQMTEPEQKDDWFLAIKACIIQFEGEHAATPNAAELWARLCSNPPSAYGIVKAVERKKVTLTIGGGNPLQNDAFKKRYSRYYPNTDK